MVRRLVVAAAFELFFSTAHAEPDQLHSGVVIHTMEPHRVMIQLPDGWADNNHIHEDNVLDWAAEACWMVARKSAYGPVRHYRPNRSCQEALDRISYMLDPTIKAQLVTMYGEESYRFDLEFWKKKTLVDKQGHPYCAVWWEYNCVYDN